MLGGLWVETGEGPAGGAAAQPRRLAVLAMLARAGERGVTRDRLQALLWPDLDEDRARRVLSQALYALRRDLGSDEAIVGLKDLRLNTDVAGCDLADFEQSVTADRLEDAARAYAGPFLHGFRLPGADEFERWVDTQRASLAHRHFDVLERLGRRAVQRGDTKGAVSWWRQAAALDPLNARVAVELMRALAAAGDAAGALQHARIYETLVQSELDLPPDAEVLALVAHIREQMERPAAVEDEPGLRARQTRESAVARPPPSDAIPGDRVGPDEAAASTPPGEVGDGPAAPAVPGAESLRPAGTASAGARQRALSLGVRRALVGIVLVAIAVIAVRALWPAPRLRSDEPVVIAIGRIEDHRTAEAPAGLGLIADLLSTSVSRLPGLRVVSTARTYELLTQVDPEAEPTAAALTRAARQAGATELIDGALYPLGESGLRLDLRRIDLGSGNVLTAATIEGTDLYSLVDSGTARLARESGLVAPAGSLANVATTSELAYRLYEEGLREYFRGDIPVARRFLDAALAEDSTFAMAAYYASLAYAGDEAGPDRAHELLHRARRLADRLGDRERLIVKAGWAWGFSDPTLKAVAETLAVRHPHEVEGHLFAGLAAFDAAEYEQSLSYMRRVVAMDSLGLRRVRPLCRACEAMHLIVSAYEAMDSLEAAAREARRWSEFQPFSARPLRRLMAILLQLGRIEEARDAMDRAAAIDPETSWITLATHYWLFAGEAERAESALREFASVGETGRRHDALWYLVIVLRHQGRYESALEAARTLRRTHDEPAPQLSRDAIAEAQVLLEMGMARRAAALFDSVSRVRFAGEPPSTYARQKAWFTAHAAGALAEAGDTVRLAAAIDSLYRLGPLSSLARDRRLHDFARGLLLEARGDLAGAAASYRRAITSTTVGYTRINVALARVLRRLDRPEEAIPLLQAGLRAGIEGSPYYVTRTELHAQLAEAWEEAGSPDSARVHHAAVAELWRSADPPFRARAERAARAADRLGGDPPH